MEAVIPPRHHALQSRAAHVLAQAYELPFMAACRGLAVGLPETEVIDRLQAGEVDALLAARETI